MPTDGVHESDRIGRGKSDIELSQGAKKLKPCMLVALAETLKMDQCLVFCRTNVDCNNLQVRAVTLSLDLLSLDPLSPACRCASVAPLCIQFVRS